MNFTHYVGKPLEGGQLMQVPACRVRRFGKRVIYGNATQYTVAELDNGEIVYLRHADQPDPKAFSAFIRKRLKGLYADAGLGQSASWDAIKLERFVYPRCERHISKWPFPTFKNSVQFRPGRSITEIPA